MWGVKLLKQQRACVKLERAQHHGLMKKGMSQHRNASSMVNVIMEEKYAIVQMNRPPVNSLNKELLDELEQTIHQLEKNKACRGMILASTSPSVFSAGLDIMEMHKPEPQRLRAFWTSLQSLWLRLYVSPLITIAAIEGHSPAGGCLLALSCDYRIMTTGKAVIGLNETRLGIVAPTWFKDTLVNTVGHRESEKMLSLGLQVTAEQGKLINLVDEAVPKELVMDRAKQVMKEWLAIPDVARIQTKVQLLRGDTARKLRDHREKDLLMFTSLVESDLAQKSLDKYLASLKK